MEDLENFIVQSLEDLVDNDLVQKALNSENKFQSLFELVLNQFLDQQMKAIDDNEKFQLQTTQLSDKVNQFQSKIDLLQLENTALKTSDSIQLCEDSFFKAFEKKNNECIKLTQILEEVQIQFTSYKTLFSETCDEKNAKIIEKTKTIKQLTRKLEDLSSTKDLQQTQNQTQFQQLEVSFKQLTSQYQNSQLLIHSLEQDNTNYLKENQLFSQTIEQSALIQQNLTSEQNKTRNLQQLLDSLEIKHQESELFIQKLNQELLQYQQQQQKFAVENESLKTQLKQLEEVFNNQLKEVDNENSHIISKELNFIQQINQLQDENQQLKHQENFVSDQTLELQNQLANLLIENDNLNQVILSQRNENENEKKNQIDVKIKQLQSKLQINETHLTHKEKENSALKSDLARIKAELSATKNLQVNKPDLSDILLIEQQELMKFQEKVMSENKNFKSIIDQKNELISELEIQLENPQNITQQPLQCLNIEENEILTKFSIILTSYEEVLAQVFSPGFSSPKALKILSQYYLNKQGDIESFMTYLANINQRCLSYIVLKKINSIFKNSQSVKSLVLQEKKMKQSLSKTQIFDIDDNAEIVELVEIN
ncbi:hypothetical protein SS50377_28258 [Spironucleus salmonicida]|uniref:Uncharacterized protein n=1 Tax=Spironucleus salmonicida TaxID=348837 RepID=V6LUY0_9EUKA|nr:hypothetical protein SS50377_28258 [Spironucleus salmonicida]|eukprot:EST48437.1 Hypothetical protein SS50377_11387 [Spironucleus salmonicida]